MARSRLSIMVDGFTLATMQGQKDVDPWAKPDLGLPRVVAANVQRMRKAKGWSQEELSRRSWLTRQTVRVLELGTADVKLSTVEQVALALGVTPVALLRETEATRAFLYANPPHFIQAPLLVGVSSD